MDNPEIALCAVHFGVAYLPSIKIFTAHLKIRLLPLRFPPVCPDLFEVLLLAADGSSAPLETQCSKGASVATERWWLDLRKNFFSV